MNSLFDNVQCITPFIRDTILNGTLHPYFGTSRGAYAAAVSYGLCSFIKDTPERLCEYHPCVAYLIHVIEMMPYKFNQMHDILADLIRLEWYPIMWLWAIGENQRAIVSAIDRIGNHTECNRCLDVTHNDPSCACPFVSQLSDDMSVTSAKMIHTVAVVVAHGWLDMLKYLVLRGLCRRSACIHIDYTYIISLSIKYNYDECTSYLMDNVYAITPTDVFDSGWFSIVRSMVVRNRCTDDAIIDMISRAGDMTRLIESRLIVFLGQRNCMTIIERMADRGWITSATVSANNYELLRMIAFDNIVDLLDWLIKRFCNGTITRVHWMSMYHCAVDGGAVGAVKYIVKTAVGEMSMEDYRAPIGITPLLEIVTTRRHSIIMIKFLLSAEAGIFSKSDLLVVVNGRPAYCVLQSAIVHCLGDVVHYLMTEYFTHDDLAGHFDYLIASSIAARTGIHTNQSISIILGCNPSLAELCANYHILLQWAVRYGRLDVIETILSKRLFDYDDLVNCRSMYEIIRGACGSHSIMSLFIKYGYGRAHFRRSGGLRVLIEKGNTDMLKLLVESGIVTLADFYDGPSRLKWQWQMNAIVDSLKGHHILCDTLLRDLSMPLEDLSAHHGWLLRRAIMRNNVDLVWALLTSGEVSMEHITWGKNRLLVHVIRENYVRMMGALIECGLSADVFRTCDVLLKTLSDVGSDRMRVVIGDFINE